MFGRFLLAIVILQLARTACTQEADDGKCKTCGVTIGQEQYCSECNGANYAPVNGACEDVETQADKKALCKAHASGACTTCGGNSFMYKDGCYSSGEGLPGHSLCLSSDGDGVCTEAAPGYFLNPLRANTKDSVVSCSDTTGFTDSGKTYRGVQYCERCDGAALTDAAGGDAKCTRCGQDKYLKDNTCVDKAQCDSGSTNKFVAVDDSENGNKCVSCSDNLNGGVANCDTCSYDEQSKKIKCTKCTDNNYLKTTSEGTSCVQKDQCKDGFFPKDDSSAGNKCLPCNDSTDGIANCATCALVSGRSGAALVTCSACTDGYKPSADKTTCEAVSNCKTPGCKACSNEGKENEVCTDCDSSTYLTPTSQCIDSCAKIGNYYGATEGAKKICKECTAANCKTCDGQGQCQACSDGFYKNGDACSPCHESCKTCSAGTASDCTECPTGKALRYGDDGTKGTCGAGCATGTGAGACKTCGLTIDGASYCSECATATEYPQNGVCSSTTVRAAATCKAGSVAKGMCNSCTNGFLRMNGGCYETTKFPGKNVCEEAAPAGDTCQTPADGYKLNNGALITCSAGCKTCTSQDQCDTCKAGYAKTGGNTKKCVPCATGCSECNADDATKCTVCAAGYYLSKEKCIACDKSDGGSITGVANCANCAPPTNNKGPVLCYLIQNTNRSGLSTGAIAGISVAVVAVVGGLVGFLCWWFLCRGKA
ncbi:VSP with INR [Giardia duodenalis]|uniref:VSP with INR n=3 Tax=Giardia intestinalis TaxID=5741 RepID=A0A644F129_GIAIC|nr:VSP with INR [Giardia intestinalis]AAD04339.1 variant-specific surface protein 417-4 [Giardia intestinalis]KAE8302112.1 VSP with INR [Giardia intestinalis]